jgi:hypothetical protein
MNPGTAAGGERFEVAYLVLSGTTTAGRCPELLRGLIGLGFSTVIAIATPTASRSLSEGTPSLMRFHAKYVSSIEAGDYYPVSFDTDDPGKDSNHPRGPDGPYPVIQRQFETLDDRQCYVETHVHGYVGHFHVRLTNFTRTRLASEIARIRNTYVEVSCSLVAVEFKEVQRIVSIIFGQHG